MNAIVLAGAKGDSGVFGEYRASLKVGGRSLLEQALSALIGLPGLGRVVLVGPEELVPPGCRAALARIVPPQGDLTENLRRGLEGLPVDEQVLVLASDLPLLTQAALNDFVQKSAAREAEIYYPIVRREVYAAAYPGSARTYLSVRDGTFTGGNVALFTPAAFFRHQGLIARAVAWRKRPRRLGRLLGWGFFLGLLMRRYTVAEIEARIASRLGVHAVAVESRFSEMGFDIDSSEDMQWIEFYWGGTLEGMARDEPDPEEE